MNQAYNWIPTMGGFLISCISLIYTYTKNQREVRMGAFEKLERRVLELEAEVTRLTRENFEYARLLAKRD